MNTSDSSIFTELAAANESILFSMLEASIGIAFVANVSPLIKASVSSDQSEHPSSVILGSELEDLSSSKYSFHADEFCGSSDELRRISIKFSHIPLVRVDLISEANLISRTG